MVATDRCIHRVHTHVLNSSERWTLQTSSCRRHSCDGRLNSAIFASQKGTKISVTQAFMVTRFDQYVLVPEYSKRNPSLFASSQLRAVALGVLCFVFPWKTA